jgi:hypothetical protein
MKKSRWRKVPSKKVRDLQEALAQAQRDVEYWQAEAERRNVKFTTVTGDRVHGELFPALVADADPTGYYVPNYETRTWDFVKYPEDDDA